MPQSQPMNGAAMKNLRGLRQGFSLVEIAVALTILSVGVLAMGASTGHVVMRARATQLHTERMAAVRQAAELVRGASWDSVDEFCAADAVKVDPYTVRCEISRRSENLLRVQLVSTGPGPRDGAIVPDVTETFAISVARPADRP